MQKRFIFRTKKGRSLSKKSTTILGQQATITFTAVLPDEMVEKQGGGRRKTRNVVHKKKITYT